MNSRYYDVFLTDLAVGLDDEAIDVIADSRIGMRRLVSRGNLSPTEQTAYQKLGRQLLKNSAEHAFSPEEAAPELDDEEYEHLLMVAEGLVREWKLGGTNPQKLELNKRLRQKFQAEKLSLVVFKAVVLHESLLVSAPQQPPISALAPVLMETLALIAQGTPVDELGHRMDRSGNYAASFVSTLLQNLEAETRPQAVYRSFEAGLWPSSLE